MTALHDKTIVITGASSGIGQATAEAFAREGARLVLAARGAEALEHVAEICRKLGADTIAVPTDVIDPDQVRHLVQKALSFGGKIDVWYSNVGLGAVGKFHEVPIDVHRQVVQANLIGHMNDAHAVLPVFLRQGHGIFINMNSIGAFAPAPYAASYSAGKYGLRGFTAALRAELSPYPHIHVCEVYPTFIDTPGVRHAGNYTGRQLSAPPPLYDARNVAAAVVGLARHPRNSVSVGAPAKLLRMTHVLVPQTGVNIVAALMRQAFARARPAEVTSGTVFTPPAGPDGIDGGMRARRRPRMVTLGAVALAGVALAFAMRQSR